MGGDVLGGLSLVTLLNVTIINIPDRLYTGDMVITNALGNTTTGSVAHRMTRRGMAVRFCSPSVIHVLGSSTKLTTPIRGGDCSIVLGPRRLGSIRVRRGKSIMGVGSGFVYIRLGRRANRVHFLSGRKGLLLASAGAHLRTHGSRTGGNGCHVRRSFHLTSSRTVCNLKRLHSICVGRHNQGGVRL